MLGLLDLERLHEGPLEVDARAHHGAGAAEGEAQRVLAVVDDDEQAGDGAEDVEGHGDERGRADSERDATRPKPAGHVASPAKDRRVAGGPACRRGGSNARLQPQAALLAAHPRR